VAICLADALERHGEVAVVRAYEARHRSPAFLDDVVVTIRGARPVIPLTGSCAVLLLTDRSRAPGAGEADRFDHTLTSSDPGRELADQLLALTTP
jgi:hypothetical protein